MEHGFGFWDSSTTPVLDLEPADAREKEAWSFGSLRNWSVVSAQKLRKVGA